MEEEARQAELNRPKTPPVFLMARNNRLDAVVEALGAMEHVDVRDTAGTTVLMVACQNGYTRLAKRCLKLGADVNAQNVHGNTALHYAFRYAFHGLGEYLIAKAHADVSVLNLDGETCYDVADWSGVG